jgi:hypothetical protein
MARLSVTISVIALGLPLIAVEACTSSHDEADAGTSSEAGADVDIICSDIEVSPVFVHVQETSGYDVCNATVSMSAGAAVYPFDCMGCPDAGPPADAGSDGGDAGRMVSKAGTCTYSVHNFRPPTALYTISVVAPGYKPSSLAAQVTRMDTGTCTRDFSDSPFIVVLSPN